MQFTTRRLLSAFIIGTTLLSSCSKDDAAKNIAPDVITAEVDGATITFNTMTSALRSSIPGTHFIQIVGFKAAANASDQIVLVLSSASPIAVGVYDESRKNSHAASVNLATPNAPSTYISNFRTDHPATITITSVSATEVEGTFHAEVILPGRGAGPGEKKSMTNGRFKVKF